MNKGPTPQFTTDKAKAVEATINIIDQDGPVDATFGDEEYQDNTDQSIQKQISKDLQNMSPVRSQRGSTLSFAPQLNGANSTSNSYVSQALQNVQS